MLGPVKQKIIYAIKNQSQSGLLLIICPLQHIKQDKIPGVIIQQKGRNDKYVIFQGSESTMISKQSILQKIQVKCIEDAKKYLISHQDYNAMIYQLTKQDIKDNRNNSNDNDDQNQNSNSNQNQQSNSRSYDQSEDDQSSLMKNKHDQFLNNQNQNNKQYYLSHENNDSSNNQIQSYDNQDDDDEDDDDSKRGRGRPKGSKNKKTIIKQIIQNNQYMMELKKAISGKIRRGKGRPKGSKNKPKQLKMDSRDRDYIKYQEGQDNMFGKRGKGRPKGSKNKIKALNNSYNNDQQNINHQKRGRGRPKGAKNKANSIISGTIQQQIEQQFIKLQYNQIDLQPYRKIQCCNKCHQKSQKRKLVAGEVQIQQIQEQLKNVTEDFGPQNKLNLLVLSIQLGDWETLDILLNKIKKTEVYFRPPFDLEKIFQKTKYTVKTKRQYLSKTGKQGINVLLHDNYQRRQLWWKQIGIERIIQSIPKKKQIALEILERLFNHSPRLKDEILTNITSFIRKGNYEVAQYLLHDILLHPTTNKLNFTQQHYSLLTGDFPVLNQLKKYCIIKQNDGNNYCAPIHCAAINPNTQFLQKLLAIFTDIINIEDSHQKKPIHYASVSQKTNSLIVLVQNGADLKQIDKKKMTPLMLACEQGITSNVQYILQTMRDPYYINLRSDQGYSALHYAVLNNSQHCVQALINDPHTQLLLQTRDKQDVFHLLAGTGNMQIFQMFIKKDIRPIHSSDKFKRTPAMIAIRNHNNEYFYRVIEQGCRIQRNDSSQNTLLHYAAAYGNPEIIGFLKAQQMQQKKNKKGLYPIQIAILKGHTQCAKLLQQDMQHFQFQQDLIHLLLTNIQGTQQYYNCFTYAWQKFVKNIKYEDKVTGNNYLHLVCSLGQEEYIKKRKQYAVKLTQSQMKKQIQYITNKLITFLLEKGLDSQIVNRKNQTPLKMCIQNYNLIGFKKLLPEKIDFQIQSSSGHSIMHCLSNLACKGPEQMIFVQKKFKNSSVNQLRINLKKIDHNGFDFLLYFVKNFIKTARTIFSKMVEQKLTVQNKNQAIAEKQGIEQFSKYEQKFIKFVSYLIQMGCDVNTQVVNKRSNSQDTYKKWGIQHFIMSFPSLKLIKFFKNKIRDFNAMNNFNQTSLHLFCMNNKKGNIFECQNCTFDDYKTQNALQYLLSNGLNPNIQDIYKALPILYAAENNQFQFMVMLRKYKSEVNFCTLKNKVPFIEIMKKSNHFKFEQIESLLKLGCDPNFTDCEKRTSLHHLVYYSQNFDASPQICKLLIQNNAKVNALDKYQRSPIFYGFTSLQNSQNQNQNQKKIQKLVIRKSSQEQLMNDKVGILQVLMNAKDINLNLLDIYRRSLVHYACQKNFFYSILYLLDKNINIEVKDCEDNTPLAICLKSNNLDQAALIIKKGVRYGYVNENGNKMSYFAYAIKNQSVGICFMLLDYGYPIQKALQEVQSEVFKQILIKKYIK